MLARFALIFTALLLAACGSGEPGAMAPGTDRIVRLAEAEIKGLDPQLVSDLASIRVAQDLYQGLTRFDARGRAEPGFATEWTSTADGLLWRFGLAPDARFSDGEPIDAALFARVFDRLRDDDVAVPNRALFDVIDSVMADGEDVLVRLNSPYPALPELLAQPAMAAVPLHRIAAVGERWTGERPLVTSGPYRLAEWRLNDHVRLERNPQGTRTEVPTGTIIWRPMDDSLAAMRLFLAGGADIASDYPADRHGWLRDEHPGLARSTSYLGSYYFAFNTRRPPFDDRRARLALAMAVEREWIVDEVMGIGNEPAWGLLPPGLAGSAYRPDWADWPRGKRLAAARVLLRRAGYDSKRPLTFEIRFNSSSEHRRVAVALSAMWEPLGVETRLLNSEAALHFAALRQADFALARSGWIADLPTADNFLAVHVPENGTGNYSGYDNPAYVQQLAMARTIADPDDRALAMRRAEAILIADMPVLPLYFYVTRSLVAPRIAGWEDNIANVHPSRTLTIKAR